MYNYHMELEVKFWLLLFFTCSLKFIVITTLFLKWNKYLYTTIQNSRKNELRKLLLYFDDVTDIDLNTIRWNQNFNKDNQNYRMLISICNLVFNNLLQRTISGNTILMDFIVKTEWVNYMKNLFYNIILEK